MYSKELPCYLSYEIHDNKGGYYKHFKYRLNFKQAKTGFNMLMKIFKNHKKEIPTGMQVNINLIGYIAQDKKGYYNLNNKMCYFYKSGFYSGGYYYTLKKDGTTNYKHFLKKIENN